MANNNFYVDISPEMQLYKILQRQSYGIDTALAEFVDNSVQSFVDKERAIKSIDGPDTSLEILITISSKNNQIVIEDNAGGINRENFQRAIRMGNEKGFKHVPGSLSVYGIGMKSSAVWFSDTWSIETSALGSKEKLSTTFDLNKLLNSGETEIEVKTDTEEVKKHYTKIIINNCIRDLKDKNEYFKDSVLPYLQETFFKFDSVSINLVYDGFTLETEEAFLKTPTPLDFPPVDKDGDTISDKSKEWRKTINFDYEGKAVRGFIMIMEKGGYHSPGIRLLRNRRVIKGTQGGRRQNKPEVLLKTSNKFSSQRVYGEISLNDFPVNFTKTDFDEGLEGLYKRLKIELTGDPPGTENDYLHQTEYFRKRPKTKKPDSEKPEEQEAKPETSEKPSRPKIEKNIPFSSDLRKLLAQLENKKMERLYWSLSRISLIQHPVLAYVGMWTLLESLATYMGKTSTISFESFYSAEINNFIKDKGKRSQFKLSIGDIHSKGNANKHSDVYEVIDARQLVSDFKSIEKFLIHCADLAVKRGSP
ncbi:MAG: ATP-binding protein [Candidatus Dadabacteria bacterium]|nr:ATP-binding protein [Candidatus Dadabacteria bacterium]